MANLTGDFDVIAQFALPAVNRVLAAMHRTERFPHSMSMRVDDTSRPGHDFDRPSVVGVVDAFGDATTDPSHIGNPHPINIGDFASGSTGGRVAHALDAIANFDLMGLGVEPIQPSHLKGKAQVQVFPPTLEINDTTGKNVTVKMEMISRYIPDPGTPPVAEFVRGDLRITAAISQVVSQVASVVSVDVKASTANINFTPQWSSTPISAQDLSGINLLIRNALKTGFLPSSSTLPSNIAHVQFKTISGAPGSVAVLLDMEGGAGNPATANQSFLSASDGFAFGVGADYVRASMQPTLDTILQEQIDPVKFDIDGWVHTWHITYTITLNSATLELENGKMVLTFKGHAHTGTSWLPDFNFTFRQDVLLAIDGATAELEFGSMSLDTSSTIVDIFKTRAMAGLARVRDRAMLQSNAKAKVRKMLSAEENLGGFLRSLLTPASGATQPVQPLSMILGYTSAEIRQSGLVLHGMVSFPYTSPPRVEYQVIEPVQDPMLPTDAVSDGPDYTALRSWIPGGTIERYEWHHQGAQGYSDANRFVLLHQGPVSTMSTVGHVAGYSPLCLTVHGRRLTVLGPVANENVSATMCGYRSFPVGGISIGDGNLAPLIALTKNGSGGMVEVIGHAPAMSSSEDSPSPNLIIHFADEVSGEKLEALPSALKASNRSDAPTAIVVVSKSSRMSRLPWSEGVTYAEDDGQLRKRYGVSASGAHTIVVDPAGRVAWKGDGAIAESELTAALAKVLAKGNAPRATMLSANARIGQSAPNFMFEHARGQPLTLRKAEGHPITIIFFNRASQPSVDAVRDAASSNNGKSVVLAINDGASASSDEFAPAIVVPDRDRRIAGAYGVTMWPTIFSIDESGIVRSIAYGRNTRGDKSRA